MKVTKPQAQTYAQKATQTWQAEGRLPPTQRFRLPRQQETRSTQIWREEDAPTSPQERRTFGLVLVDTQVDAGSSSASSSSATMTPEGIPVRPVPEGESALKKTGPDKPLWTRPE